jgi:hypothetical protein
MFDANGFCSANLVKNTNESRNIKKKKFHIRAFITILAKE